VSRSKKVLLTVLVLGVVAGLIVFGVSAAYVATTTNPNNSVSAGSVNIGDNDSDTALYSVSNRKPGDTVSKCIRVTYTGTLPSTVKLYRSAFTGGTGLEPYLNIKVERADSGTVTNYATCAGFDATPTTEYNGTLGALGTAFTDAAAVVLEDAAGGAVWDENDAVDYKVTATLLDDNNGNGLVTGTHAFVWEARNN
jgi:hypothetical protein